MAIERWHFLVEGRVQGVGYRAFVGRKARALGLTGYVRNLPDGRVEAEAEGKPEKLQALSEAMRSGPRRARVDAVLRSAGTPRGGESGFLIR